MLASQTTFAQSTRPITKDKVMLVKYKQNNTAIKHSLSRTACNIMTVKNDKIILLSFTTKPKTERKRIQNAFVYIGTEPTRF